MISQMSQRERTLALLVGGAIFVLINVFLIKFCMTKYAESRDEKTRAEGDLSKFRAVESERSLWSQRDAWLTSRLVPMGDAAVVNKSQREYLQETAKKHQVLIESFNPGVANKLPAYTTLGVRVECKGKWDQIAFFLNELQAPENFTVVESMDLKVDPSDKTQLRATMTIAKWFSPNS